MHEATLHGAVRRLDALVEGDDGLVRRELRRGRLRREHQGVYVDVRHDFDHLARLGAALLRAGPGAHLSHGSAAWLHGLVDTPPSAIHVSVPHRRRPRPIDGVTLHRPSLLPAADRGTLHDLPVTGIERTVLDLIRRLPERERVAFVAQTVQAGFTTRDRLWACTQRSGRLWGRPALEQALAELEPGFETVIELDLAKACRAAGLVVRAQATVALPNGKRYRLDLLDEALLIDAEADGARHLSLDTREGDLERDEQLRTAGIEVVRFTGRQLTRHRAAVESRLRSVRERRVQETPRLSPGVRILPC
jgi:very-short-patch-repair endonuclease